jgi:biopolymer transport protein ExbD
MKFARNARPFRGQLDAAPFAGVFFCLVLLLLLGMLVYTPGVRLQLPEAAGVPGTTGPSIWVALDSQGQFYFKNQNFDRAALKASLEDAVKKSSEPLTLVVQADKSVSYDRLMDLALLARAAGIKNALLAVLPRTLDAGAPNQSAPLPLP